MFFKKKFFKESSKTYRLILRITTLWLAFTQKSTVFNWKGNNVRTIQILYYIKVERLDLFLHVKILLFVLRILKKTKVNRKIFLVFLLLKILNRLRETSSDFFRNNDQQAEPLLDDHCSSVIVANVTDASTTALTAMTPHFPPSPPLSSSTPTEPTTGCTGNGVDYLSPYINNNGGDFGGGGGKPLSPPTDAFSAVAVGDKYLDEKDDEFPAHEETFRDLLRSTLSF